MATEYQHTPAIKIHVIRCFSCRLFYGFESNTEFNTPHRCPHCASDRVMRGQQENERLIKSLRALRGVVSRLSRRRARKQRRKG
jgi:hypothetical protein